MSTTGVVYIHSTPAALCPHIEWALSSVLGGEISLRWQNQPAEAGTCRSEFEWANERDVAAGLASALRSCQRVRFEVTRDSVAGLGERYSYTPNLGMFRGQTMANGDLVLTENQIRSALLTATRQGEPVTEALAELLGQPWDDELEVFRHADPLSRVRWLHQVG